MNADARVTKSDLENIVDGIGIRLLALSVEAKKWDGSKPETQCNTKRSPKIGPRGGRNEIA